VSTENLEWSKVPPTVRTWNATDGVNTWSLTITDAGGSYFNVELKKDGTSQGAIQFATVEQVADLFEAVATDLRAEGL